MRASYFAVVPPLGSNLALLPMVAAVPVPPPKRLPWLVSAGFVAVLAVAVPAFRIGWRQTFWVIFMLPSA